MFEVVDERQAPYRLVSETRPYCDRHPSPASEEDLSNLVRGDLLILPTTLMLWH